MHDDIRALDRFPWDAAEPLVVLTVLRLRHVLARHEQGLLTDDDLEVWAEALEARDDIGFEHAHRETIRECLFELSTPLLTGKSEAEVGEEWRARLLELSDS
jgi:hypothetical protein